MFSPYYAAARRRYARADPCNHVAMNIALYGTRGPGWAMTERPRRCLARTPCTLTIGPSALQWRDGTLVAQLDEISVPWPRRLRGTITLRPAASPQTTYTLDPAGLHRWTPLAPCARVRVDLDRPGLRWSGQGYLDSNDGDAPLEESFSAWHWSRATLADGSTVVFYDIAGRQGAPPVTLARRFYPDGRAETLPMPPREHLPRGRWGMLRTAHGNTSLTKTLEDSPFYARSLVTSQICGESVVAMHESLSLDRFRTRWVQALLPFRMPRRW